MRIAASGVNSRQEIDCRGGLQYIRKHAVAHTMNPAYDIPEIEGLYRFSGRDPLRFSGCTAEAYRGYPLFDYVFKGKYRAETVNLIFSTGMRSLGDSQVSIANNEDAEAIATFVPPGFYGTSLMSFIKTGGLGLLYRIGPGALKRLDAFEKYGMTLKRKYADEGSWYLYNLTVRPGSQGKGLASKVMNLCSLISTAPVTSATRKPGPAERAPVRALRLRGRRGRPAPGDGDRSLCYGQKAPGPVSSRLNEVFPTISVCFSIFGGQHRADIFLEGCTFFLVAVLEHSVCRIIKSIIRHKICNLQLSPIMRKTAENVWYNQWTYLFVIVTIRIRRYNCTEIDQFIVISQVPNQLIKNIWFVVIFHSPRNTLQ